VVGQAADADAVDAGLGDCSNGVETHAAGGFEEEADASRVAHGDGGGEGGGVHVVEKHDIEPAAAGGEDDLELVETVDLEFNKPEPSRAVGKLTGPAARVQDEPGEAVGIDGGDVVVLDQHGVEEADAVAEAPAAANGVFLERSEARGGLACVEQAGREALEPGDELGGAGGDPGETRDEVEQRALRAQDLAQRAGDGGDPVARGEARAVVNVECGAGARGHDGEQGGDAGNAGEGAGLAGAEVGARRLCACSGDQGGDVAGDATGAEIFIAGRGEQPVERSVGGEGDEEIRKGEGVEVEHDR